MLHVRGAFPKRDEATTIIPITSLLSQPIIRSSKIILLYHSLLRSKSRTTSPIRHSRKQTHSPFECPMQTMLGPIILILTPHVHGSNRNTGGESGDHDDGYCPCGGVDKVGNAASASASGGITVGIILVSIGTVIVAVTVVATILFGHRNLCFAFASLYSSVRHIHIRDKVYTVIIIVPDTIIT